MVKGIVFDLFGTVVSNQMLFRPVCEKMASDFSLSLRTIENDFVRLYRKHFHDYHKSEFRPEKFYYYLLISELLEMHGLKADVEAYCNYMYASFGRLPAYPDSRILKKLCKKYTIAIITNADDIFVRKVLESNRIPYHFLMTSEMAKSYKPSIEIFEKTLQVANLDRHEVVFVGDSIRVDMMGATGAGIKGILIDRTGSYLDYAPRISNLEELIGLIESL